MIRACPVCNEAQPQFWLESHDRFHWRREPYQLVRCPVCSLIWLQNAPEPSEIAAHYGKEYHGGITQSGEKRALERWREHRDVVLARSPSPGAILYICCSSGAFLKTMMAHGWKPAGIEIDPEVAEKARQNTGADIYCGNAPDATFSPASFEAITCVHTLEHQYQPRELVAQAWSWLKPGGIFYVVVPNIASWEARLFRSYWYGLEVPRHLTFFSESSLRRIGEQAGFITERIVTRADCHIEASTKYLIDAAREKIGLRVKPLAGIPEPGILRRLIRKPIRISALLAFRRIAQASGNGASLAAVFRKPLSTSE